MGNKTRKLRVLPDPLPGPAKIMVDKWGKNVVEDVPLWQHVTQVVSPLIVCCLRRCRVMLEERELFKSGKEKHK